MTDTVLLRRSHYDVLGLTPSATAADVAQAFATELRKPRAFGDLGAISIAYETLRDPIKRRAYDASLGLKKQGEAVKVAGASFLYPAMTAPLRTSGVAASPVAVPETAPALTAEPAFAVESPSEALLRRLAEPPYASPAESAGPRHDPAPVDLTPDYAPDVPEPDVSPATLAQVDAIRKRIARTEGGSFEWKRPATIAAALIASVGLFGAWAGWEAGNDMEQLPGAAKAAVPPAKPAGSPVLPEQLAKGPDATRTAAPASQSAAPLPTANARAASAEARSSEPESAEADPLALVDQSPNSSPSAVAASLPLSNRVIASTIARIGYPCGQVMSSATMDGGAAGAFKVTCTSGHSYQATPVRGRYRFRRL